jgi:hypothetical protein
MATDVARLSFDPGRRYTGVVTQQGRVALEAEQNEERVIGAEERREVLLDVVGRAGTPDDGYAVSAGPDTDLVVGPGTMYVGGLRVTLDEEIRTSEQPDWLDQPVVGERPLGREHVLLLVTERDVTAVEDPALLEVALGGPDGAARTRTVQRVLRHEVEAGTCADALEESARAFTREGLTFEPETMRLASASRLLVTWQQDPEAGSACEPTSSGGYLGAENQCIRFQVTAVHRDGTFDAVWGYDDASHLYRVTPDTSTNPVLTLDRSPVDDHHRPRTGQAAQVLRSTAALRSTDQVVEGYVAALGGVVAVLTAPYDPDSRTVELPVPLPADHAGDPQLYLRVWEEHLTGLTLGDPVDLTGTGMRVTLTSTMRTGRLHVDDFWCVGVRPETPTAVYPARYLRTPQPPDGPRQWVCPLAVIEWLDQGVLDVVDDCRRPFDPLTEIEPGRGGGCCCTVEVRPDDAPRLQAIIDRAVANRSTEDRADRVTVCFEQGRYELLEPIVLRARHSNLELRGCGGAVLVVHPDLDERKSVAFAQGLVVLVEADDVTITGFELELPHVLFEFPRISGVSGGAFDAEAVRAVNDEARGTLVSIGVRAVTCAALAVEGCVFRYTLGDEGRRPMSVFGAGVLAAGTLRGLRLTGNEFLAEPFDIVPEEGGAVRVLAGLQLSPVSLSREARKREVRALGAARLPALLDDAVVSGNRFVGVPAPVLALADFGQVTVQDNQAEDCYGGLWLLESRAVAETDLAVRRAASIQSGLADGVAIFLLHRAGLYPLPDDDERPRGFVVEAPARTRKYFADAQESARASTEALAERLADADLADADLVDAVRVVTMQPAPLVAVLGSLVALERLRAADSPALRTTITLGSNTVECAVPNRRISGPALYVYSFRPPAIAVFTDGSAGVVTGNRFVSREALFAAVVVVGLDTAAVTGNVVWGPRADDRYALVVGALGAGAITGNVVSGRAVLPANRPFPAPLDTWLPFNTIG